MQRPQRGFTLVEIAIVLVVIGLLLGGVLKGQELIASSRVRNMADQQAGIQAAYYGFQDRYRAIPGDMPSSDATAAIGTTVNFPTDGLATAGNGKIDADWEEVNAVWEQLSKAGFIKGNYEGADSLSTSDTSPTNVFNGVVTLVRDDGYMGSTPPVRLLLHMGRNVPADIARELDVKLDDGEPTTGVLRNALDADSPVEDVGESASGCTETVNSEEIWDIADNVQDCNPTFLF